MCALLREGGARRVNTGAGPSKHVLVVGAACSGTAGIGQTLARIARLGYVHEPDNPVLEPFAARARAGLGAFPAIAADDVAAKLYTRLWDVALGQRTQWVPSGRARRRWRKVDVAEKLAGLDPPTTQPDGSVPPAELSRPARTALRLARPVPRGRARTARVVSSVDAPLALDWLVHRYHPHVVLVRRHPLDVVASRMLARPDRHDGDAVIDARDVEERVDRWRIPQRPLTGHGFARLVWVVGFEMSAYQEVADAHHGFQIVDYRQLCTHPAFEFRRLLSDLELVWQSRDDELAAPHPRAAGDGHAASTTPALAVHLSPEQASLARDLLALFPIARHYHDLLPPQVASGR